MSEPDIQRAPPHSIDAEMGVLGSMLLSPREGIAEAVDRIGEDYFFVPAHQTLFHVLVELWEKEKAIDLLTFTQVLGDRGLLEGVGGAAYVTNLYLFVPTAANLAWYLNIVRDKHILREIIASATQAVRRAYEEQDDLWPEEEDGDQLPGILEDYQSNAIEIGRLARDNATSKPLSAFVPSALKAIENTYHGRGRCTGISTGFKDLDRIMNGFEAPLTYYFAARPAMGKSALMKEFAENIAINAAAERKRVKIFSLEMTGEMLAKRMICSRANIELKALRHGFMDHDAVDYWEGGSKIEGRATIAAKDLLTDYVQIDEKGDLSIMEFRARARKAVLQDRCELIMIDYLQRMKGSGRKRNRDSRELEINEIAQGISATAKELKIPIVVLAQLNRKAEDRWDGLPELGDLRESGSLEQEARFVGLLWRPWYYAKAGARQEKMVKNLAKQWSKIDFEDPEVYKQFAVCIVAKQNEGPVGPVPLRFVADFGRYEPEDPERPLFSNRADQRQEKPEDPPPADLDQVNETLAMAKDVFPNAKVTGNGEDK